MTSRVRAAGPAVLTAVTVAAVWTAIALAAPPIATGNSAALVAVVAAAFFGAATSRRGTGPSRRGTGPSRDGTGPSHSGIGPSRRTDRRLLRPALAASAGTALLIFLVINLVLPGVRGFISTTHPPVYTPATRLVDPAAEFGIFVLLAAALGVDVLRTRIRTRRAAAREKRPGYGTGPNEMVVNRTAGDSEPAAPGVTTA